jgi:hypothetical protein
MLLSVPTLAVAKILVMHYYSKHVLGAAPEGAEAQGAEQDADPSAASEPSLDGEEPAPENAAWGQLTPPERGKIAG